MSEHMLYSAAKMIVKAVAGTWPKPKATKLQQCRPWVEATGAAMRRAASFMCVGAILLVSNIPVGAVVGTLDTEDKFPFVVQLDIQYSDGRQFLCSAAVSRAGLVSTAAHCIWRPDAGLATRVYVKYRDADGRQRRVREHKIFYPKAFEREMTNWDAAMKGARPAAWNVMDAHRQDIAFIVPAEFVEVEGFPHWGTELLQNESCFISMEELAQYGDRPPPRCAGKFSQEKFDRELGDLRRVKAMAVGYGDYDCKSFQDRSYGADAGCRSDGQRRHVEVPLVPRKSVGAPDVWCTGQVSRNDEMINPVQHGDSGGPRFIRALDGRWLFVGYTSGGNNSSECASSIFGHLDLWKEAALYMARIRYRQNGADNWNKNQMRRFLAEVLDSWSAPNDESLRRLGSLYSDGGEGARTAEEKRRLFGKWVTRRFAIKSRTDIEVEEDSVGDPVNGVKATVEWQLEDADGARVFGNAQFNLVVRYNFDNELKLAYGSTDIGPIILKETCHLLSGGPPPAEMQCPKTPPKAWDHNGSVMKLSTDGARRFFVYDVPRQSLSDFGVKKGTVLFEGVRRGKTYDGIAYIFTRACGSKHYQVSGEVAEDDRSVTLRGQAPRVDAACNVVGYRDDVLVFTFQGD
ncbi:MAG: hypothetical protein K2Z80_08900 [Xanthobacteraceae bacterium]|nr:hypothetical protein [Xanthobacteraceae bacterium]